MISLPDTFYLKLKVKHYWSMMSLALLLAVSISLWDAFPEQTATRPCGYISTAFFRHPTLCSATPHWCQARLPMSWRVRKKGEAGDLKDGISRFMLGFYCPVAKGWGGGYCGSHSPTSWDSQSKWGDREKSGGGEGGATKRHLRRGSGLLAFFFFLSLPPMSTYTPHMDPAEEDSQGPWN